MAGNADIVVSEGGLRADDIDLRAFAEGARHAKETRQHTISMAEQHDPTDLADAAFDVARESDAIDGNWMVGIHTDSDGNAHIHIAEFSQRSRGTDFDIYEVREQLENRIDDPPAW